MSNEENRPIRIGDVGQPHRSTPKKQSQSGKAIAADLLKQAQMKQGKAKHAKPQSEAKSARVVTMIEAQKRAGRYNIYLDGQYAFPVSESVLIEFRLFKGMTITPALQTQISDADDVARAYNRALDYLSGQLRSEREVVTKLASLDIPDEVINATLQRLRELQLVDDLAYAKAYVRTMIKTSDKGPVVIRQHLRQKGIGETLIDQALVEFSTDDRLANGIATATKLAHHYANKPFAVQQQKVRQSLMQKGFQQTLIEQIMTEVTFERDDEQENALLQREAAKVWQRNRRYAGRERQNRTKRTLYGKGYQLTDINRELERLINEED